MNDMSDEQLEASSDWLENQSDGHDCWECDMPNGGVRGRKHSRLGRVWLCLVCDSTVTENEYEGGN